MSISEQSEHFFMGLLEFKNENNTKKKGTIEKTLIFNMFLMQIFYLKKLYTLQLL